MTVTTPGGTATAPRPRPRSWLQIVRALPHELTHRRPSLPLDDPRRLVRPRRHGDLAGAARLLAVVYSGDHYPDQLSDSPRAWLTEEVLDAWVATRHGRVLGHVATAPVAQDLLSAARWRELTALSPEAMRGVSRFFVRRSERGHGLGTALLEAATADIRARGLAPVMETVTESREPIPALHSAGWHLLAVDARNSRDSRWWVHRYAAFRPDATPRR